MKYISKLGNIIFHPFIWAIYPPLALLGRNIDQLAPGMAVRALLVSILGAGVALVVMRLILRDWHKAAALTSIILIAFFSYGHIYALVEDRQVFGILLGRHRFLGGIYLILLGVILTAVWKRQDLRQVTQALNLIGLVIGVFPGYQIATYYLENAMTARQLRQDMQTQPGMDLKVPEGQVPPDIYYIILYAK